MRLLVCGGRKYDNTVTVYRTLDRLHRDRGPITAMIQGGAKGADKIAREWAMTKPGIERWRCDAIWHDLSHPDAVIRARPDGSQYDAMAGIRRNTRMLEWKPDVVVAFPGGDGTADMVAQARAAGVEVIEVSR